MESKNKQTRIEKNSQLQADDILDEMIPLEHNEKRAETTSLQFWMDTESKFETLIIQPGGMHKFYSRVLKSSSITDILFFLYFFYRGKAYVCFLYGDYKYLCKVMGISGASSE